MPGSARGPSVASSLHAPPVLPLSPLITAGWRGEEGRWPRRRLGGRLPLSREPPWEPEDGGGSSGRPGGGGAEAQGAERGGGGGGRARQRPVVAHQNRKQRQPRGHLSEPTPASAGERRPPPGPPASPRLPRPRQATGLGREKSARRAPTAPRGAGRRPWTCGGPCGPAAEPRPCPLAAAFPELGAPRAGPARGEADMGAKQSGPAAANGRTRAYSGSDLPSSSSSSGGVNGTAGGGGGGARAAAAGRFPAQVPGAHQPSASGGAAAASAAPAAPRSRSLGGAVGSVASGARAAQSSFNIPNSSSGPYGSQDSVHSSPEDGGGGGSGSGRDRPAGGGPGGPRLVIGSLPAHLSPHMFGGFKCPVCSKFVPSDEMDLHLVMCLTKPRITYNEDVLSKDAGECAICLEELQQGDTIARLPCLCIYHKGCIDEWFEVNRSCPEHPSD